MARRIILIVIAGALLPAITAHAKMDTATKLRLQSIEARLPDADKLAQLEARVNRIAKAEGLSDNAGGNAGGTASGGGGDLFSLSQEVEGLKEDVRNLRGEVDEIKHEVQQNQQRQRKLYQDLDKRLRTLEQGGSPAGGDNTGFAGQNGSAQSAANPAQAKEDYQAALSLLRNGKYTAAEKAFNQFLQQYPDNDYSDNAWYWLGEAHYVDRHYDQSVAAFNHVINDFPKSNKRPGAMLKLGIIQDEQGNKGQARQALQRVIQTYPQDAAADKARKRLQTLGSGA